MASTNVNVGRVQGAGFFYSTYADDNIATTIDKGTILSELTIFEKDMIVDAKGRLYEVTSILGDTVNVEYKSTVQGEKGDKGDTGDIGTVTLNAEVTQVPSFYAPTVGGNANEILISTGGEPVWTSDIKGFKFAIENLDMSASVTPSIECTGYSILGRATTLFGDPTVGSSVILTHQFNFTVSINEPLDVDLYISITNGTVSSSSDKYKYSSQSLAINASLTKGALVSSGNSTISSSLFSNITVCIIAGETTVNFSCSITMSTTVTDIETSTSGEISMSTYYMEFSPYDIDSITGLNAVSVYIENGKSTLSCNNAITIDSTGKIECAELWVGGKQIV